MYHFCTTVVLKTNVDDFFNNLPIQSQWRVLGTAALGWYWYVTVPGETPYRLAAQRTPCFFAN